MIAPVRWFMAYADWFNRVAHWCWSRRWARWSLTAVAVTEVAALVVFVGVKP